MSTAFRLTASNGSTSLPELGRIFPLPVIFTEGSLFSKTMLALNPPGRLFPQLLRIPAFTLMVKLPSSLPPTNNFTSLPLMV